MRPRDARTYLWHIVSACEAVQSFTAGRTFADYAADLQLKSAVERQFEIMGEALRRALDADPHLEAEISHSRRIIDFRNILIHGYDGIHDAVAWDTVQADVPRLKREAEGLLRERQV